MRSCQAATPAPPAPRICRLTQLVQRRPCLICRLAHPLSPCSCLDIPADSSSFPASLLLHLLTMASFLQNYATGIIQNAATGAAAYAITTGGRVVGDVVISAGDLIEGGGRKVGDSE